MDQIFLVNARVIELLTIPSSTPLTFPQKVSCIPIESQLHSRAEIERSFLRHSLLILHRSRRNTPVIKTRMQCFILGRVGSVHVNQLSSVRLRCDVQMRLYNWLLFCFTNYIHNGHFEPGKRRDECHAGSIHCVFQLIVLNTNP